MKKYLPYLVVATTAITIIVNMLAVFLPLNGLSTKYISDLYPVYFTPAPYVFSIWGIIYIGLISFSVYQLIAKLSLKNADNIRLAMIIANVANALWIFLWHYLFPVLSIIPMFVLLGSLIYIFNSFTQEKYTKNERWFMLLPAEVYLGWISIATVANMSVVLYVLKWNGFGIAAPIWSAIMIIVASILAVTMLMKHKSFAFALVVLWAFSGIINAFEEVPVIVLTTILTTICIVIAGVYAFAKDRFIKS